jgi:signal transduction histidine kinase
VEFADTREETAMDTTARVLVVDDYAPNAEMARDVLQGDFEVVVAYGGAEALETAASMRPDVVVLDISMPEVDGYEVCERLKADPAQANVKVILVSAHIRLEQRLRGYEAGADDYVRKPYDAAELRAKAKVFTRLKQAEDRLQALNASLEEQVETRTRQLLASEEMAMLGRNTAGVIHNLNNPLAGVLGYAQLIASAYPEDARPQKLQKAAEQMRSILTSLLNTMRGHREEERADIDLNAVLGEQVELLRMNRFVKHKVELEARLGEIPLVRGVAHYYGQCLSNILKNAVDALVDAEERRLTVESVRTDDHAEIRITDTGCGMTPEQLERIFDPFFTTKPLVAEEDRPVGTGLGLPSAREIIQSYGGEILAESAPGTGTTFRIRVPAAQTRPAVAGEGDAEGAEAPVREPAEHMQT